MVGNAALLCFKPGEAGVVGSTTTVAWIIAASGVVAFVVAIRIVWVTAVTRVAATSIWEAAGKGLVPQNHVALVATLRPVDPSVIWVTVGGSFGCHVHRGSS